MLPITTHRSFHVPHTLAIAAAMAALIAAFAWSADQAPMTEAAQPQTDRIVDADPEGVVHQAHAQSDAGEPDVRPCIRNGSCARHQASGLLPLVLPALPTR